jgi:hypothetical protein
VLPVPGLTRQSAFPGFFVGQRCQNLGCNRILLIRRQSGDLFQRLLQQRGRAAVLPAAALREESGDARADQRCPTAAAWQWKQPVRDRLVSIIDIRAYARCLATYSGFLPQLE